MDLALWIKSGIYITDNMAKSTHSGKGSSGKITGRILP
jgi:hypothetical protein